MTEHIETTEGTIDFRGFHTWYRVAGDLTSGRVPLLLLHGGPGGPSACFEPFEKLASTGRAVVRYDQLGCGRSDRPNDTTLFTVETFIEELDAVRRELGLDRVHLLGWSWGGMLAMEYMTTKPRGVQSLVLASAPPDIPLYIEENRRLRSDLPERAQRVMDRFERTYSPPQPRRADGSKPGVSARQLERMARVARLAHRLGSRPFMQRVAGAMSHVPFLRRAAFEIASLEHTSRHICRLGYPFPMAAYRTVAGIGRPVYETMWGPSEFLGTGTLTSWTVVPRLAEIDVPTLVTAGRHDSVTPAQVALLADGIPGAEVVTFEQSGHCAIYEEPERYLDVLGRFLERAESCAEPRQRRQGYVG